jgi:hypothetical protein
MRSILLSFSALVLILSIAPASAMCGGGMNMGQQAQAPTTTGGVRASRDFDAS